MAKSRSQAKATFARDEGNIGDRLAHLAANLFRTDQTAGTPLIVAAIVALILANSPWSESFRALWKTEVLLHLADATATLDIKHVINDLLMPFFFLVVGLELKHELTVGQLSTWKRAAMPLYIGIGGMIVPAALFLCFNLFEGGAAQGWAIPMATDIAFVLAILIMLGDRVPDALKVLTLAFAAVDDVGGVLAIALFYSDDISLLSLSIAGGIFLLIVVTRQLGVRSFKVYAALGVAAIIVTYSSGIHTTIAGVLLGLLVPSRPQFSRDDYAQQSELLLRDYQRIHQQYRELTQKEDRSVQACAKLESLRRQEESVLGKMDALTTGTEAPVDLSLRLVNPWVSYLILPLFALANAGVTLSAEAMATSATSLVAWGVFVGLAVGKPVGLLLAAYVATRAGIASLPEDIDWRSLTCMAFLAGIGFTVSLFIAELAYSSQQLDDSKIGILAATLVSVVLGLTTVAAWPGKKSATN